MKNVKAIESAIPQAETKNPPLDKQKSNPSLQEDIAIIGIHGIYPLAKDLHEFWSNLVKGRNCITEIPPERWSAQDYPVHLGKIDKYYTQGGFIADVDKFDPLFFNLAPHDASLIDPQERLFLESTWSTLEDAGYTRESLHKSTGGKVGVYAGVTFNYYPALHCRRME